MIYRTLGKTGLKVSQLGFGAMRLPMVGEGDERRVNRELAIPMIHKGFEGGINYIDTAVGYCNRDGQRAVGDALDGWAEKIIVSTKNPYYGEDESQWWANLTDSLEFLGVKCIDIYNHHGIRYQKRYVEAVEPRVGKWMHKALEQGLIKHIGCSFHDDNDSLIKMVDTGYVESITLQYNMLDRRLEEGIAYAHDKGVGVVVMGPVAGGRLGVSTEALSGAVAGVDHVPELALRFVLANPHVSIALSGMSQMRHVQENLAVAGDEVSLTAADKAAIDSHLDKLKGLADLYCTGCGYCTPCPAEVRISAIFELYNYGRVYGLWEHARKRYARLLQTAPKHGRGADACTDCGDCEEKCPQNIPIREQLREAHKALTGQYSRPDSPKQQETACESSRSDTKG